MASSAIGHKTYMGIGEETTWATAVARAKWVEIMEESVRVSEGLIVAPSLLYAGVKNTRLAQGAIGAAGTVRLVPQFEDCEKLWRAVTHNIPVTSRPDVTNAPSVYSHVFSIRDQLSAYSLTLEFFKDVSNFLATGCMLNRAKWSVRPNEPLECELDIVAKDVVTGTQSPSQLFSTAPIMHGGLATLSWGGTAIDCESAEVEIINNLDTARRFIGSRYISQPHRGDKLAVTGRFTTEFQDMSQYNDFRNATERALQLKVEGGFIGSTAYKYLFQIDCAVVRLLDSFPSVASPGRIKLDIPFQAFRTASANEMTITAQGTIAAV